MSSFEDNNESSGGGEPYDVEAVGKRRIGILKALNDPKLTGYEGGNILKKYWLEELGEDIQPAIDRNEKKWGNPEALVVSFTDAGLHYEPDAGFAGLFFNSLGAHVSLDDGVTELDTSPETFSTLLSSDTNLVRVSTRSGLNDLMDNIPPGSFIVTNEDDSPTHLVCETDIEGVRLILEGPGINNPKGSNRSVRPMLLIKMADQKFQPLGEELPPDPRKTWTEIHGRQPNSTGGSSDYGKIISDQAILEGDTEMALAGSEWVPLAKGGEDIMVTPTILKENPAITSNAERIEIIKEAFAKASEHFDLANSGRAEPLVGSTMWAFNILADVLGMSPEEIINDGEAMGTLVEYLEEVARAKPNIYGHSTLLPPAEEGNELAELTALIKDTWDFPDQSGISSNMLSDRVNWKKRPRPPLRSN